MSDTIYNAGLLFAMLLCVFFMSAWIHTSGIEAYIKYPIGIVICLGLGGLTDMLRR
jgi:hypothetical protein